MGWRLVVKSYVPLEALDSLPAVRRFSPMAAAKQFGLSAEGTLSRMRPGTNVSLRSHDAPSGTPGGPMRANVHTNPPSRLAPVPTACEAHQRCSLPSRSSLFFRPLLSFACTPSPLPHVPALPLGQAMVTRPRVIHPATPTGASTHSYCLVRSAWRLGVYIGAGGSASVTCFQSTWQYGFAPFRDGQGKQVC